MTAPAVTGVVPPVAGVARRAGAASIDIAVIVGGELFASLVLGVVLDATGTTRAELATGQLGAAAAILRALTQLVLYLGPIAYLYVGWRRGATIGQRSLHCELRAEDGIAPATSSQVVLRLCGLWFSVVPAGLGLVWGWFRHDRRGWSDLFAGTVVVHRPRLYGWAPAPAWVAQPWSAQPPWAPPPLWNLPGWPSQPPPGWSVPPPPAAPPMPPPVMQPPPPPPPPSHSVTAAMESAAPGADTTAARTLWTWTDVAPVVVLILPLSFGVQWVIVTALRWLLSGIPRDTRVPIEATASDVAAYGAIFGLVVLFVKVRRHAPLAALGLRRVPWRWLAAALPFAFLAFVLEGITGLLSRSIFPMTPSNQCIDIRSAYRGALVLALLGVAVVAPLVEEIVFRGMVFGWLRERVPLAVAVLVSAALFSLEHISFLEVTLFLPIFSVGVVLAILYHHARSVWPTVLVHGTFNLIATLVLFNTVSC